MQLTFLRSATGTASRARKKPGSDKPSVASPPTRKKDRRSIPVQSAIRSKLKSNIGFDPKGEARRDSRQVLDLSTPNGFMSTENRFVRGVADSSPHAPREEVPHAEREVYYRSSPQH